MGILTIEGVTHWSIPVNNLDESESFYGDLLGLESRGRLGSSGLSCFNVGDHNILLALRKSPVNDVTERDPGVHYSFTVSPEMFEKGCKVFHEKGIQIDALEYRAKGHFCGRELYFFDPSGNRLELRDPTWVEGMPEPPYEEIVRS